MDASREFRATRGADGKAALRRPQREVRHSLPPALATGRRLPRGDRWCPLAALSKGKLANRRFYVVSNRT